MKKIELISEKIEQKLLNSEALPYLQSACKKFDQTGQNVSNLPEICPFLTNFTQKIGLFH